MGIRGWNLWKHRFFKSASSLFSSNQRTIKCFFVSETGIIGLVDLPLESTFVTEAVNKMSWTVIHKLMMPLAGCDEWVLPISERSYVPLDPLGRLTDEEKKTIVPVDAVAATKYNESFNNVQDDNQQKASQSFLKAILTFMMVVIACVIIALIARGCK